MRELIAVLITSFLAIGVFGGSVDQLEWDWSIDKASLDFSVKKHLQGYELEIVNEKEKGVRIHIYSKIGRQLVCTIERGHSQIVFTRWKDVLYIAEYWSMSSGCWVVAQDLKSGKRLWKSPLHGIGPVAHSKYRNLVNIETDGRRVIIAGNESQGRYVEHLDISNGKMLANKQFAPDPNSLFE